jgi:hypothetical protein
MDQSEPFDQICTVRIKSGLGESSRPELRVPAAAPWPELASDDQNGDLGH